VVQQTVNGDSITEVTAGGLAYFTTSLATNSTGNAFVTISVEGSDSTALGVGHFKSVIGMGDCDLTMGFRIPSDAVSGMVNVHVNVWADENVEVPITTEVAANIEIIGVDPTDLGAFTVAAAGFPYEIGDTVEGFTTYDIVNQYPNALSSTTAAI
jgi:hypothetical protein